MNTQQNHPAPGRRPIRILFVCLGNICRSPAAEGIFKAIVQEHGSSDLFIIDSAGLGGWHEGELADPRMRRAASEAGYNLTHRARQVSSNDFSHFDLIIGMDRQNIQALSHLASTDQERRKILPMTDFLQRHHGHTAIEDPYYGTEADFRHVVSLLEDACQGLYRYLTEDRHPL